MAFRIELTPQAEADLRAIYAWVATAAPYRGPRWFDRLENTISSLSEHPMRCPVEPALCFEDVAVRVLLFGRRPHVYRVYFAVLDDLVSVLHIRHSAKETPVTL